MKQKDPKWAGKNISQKMRLAVLIGLVVLVLDTCLVAAKYYLDAGNDIVITHDALGVDLKTTVKGDLSEEYDKNNGTVLIKKNSGNFGSNESLDIQIDLYYSGESYSAIRVMMIEQWYGTYKQSMDAQEPELEGILPEQQMTLNLTDTIPMSDHRAVDGYVYLNQYQTTLTQENVDTMWKDQETILSCTAADETLYYRGDNGDFSEVTEVEEGKPVWRKYSLIASASVPELTDESDSVFEASASQLRLYLKAEAVQFNRYTDLWGIDQIPDQTNSVPEEKTEGSAGE
jgi:ribosomal protein S24E